MTTIKQVAFNICNTFNEHSGVNNFWSVEKLAEVLGKFRKFDSIDSYDFHTFYTTLPHKLIKHKFSYLIKWSFVDQAVITYAVTTIDHVVSDDNRDNTVIIGLMRT